VPDKSPADNNEEQPAWMTLEGRQKIRFKNLSAGEEYTRDELLKLHAYWTEERTQAVAEWIDAGADIDAVPRCVPSSVLRQMTDSSEYRTALKQYDLRCIDLRRYLHTTRTDESPRPSLSEAHLEYASLSGAHLEHASLTLAHLEHAHLSWAHLEHADLHAVHLEHASLFGVHLEHANLEVAHLEHANLTLAEILETNFTGVYLDDTVLSLLRWQDERRRDPEATMFRFFDIRGVRYSDPLFDRWVKQANFIWRCRETWWNPWASLAKRLRNRKQAPKERGWFSRKLSKWPPPLWLLWKMTCNCGRGFWRWVGWCLGIAIVFGFIFWLGGIVEVPGRHHNELTYFYFSIVTFTTLGFGDVTPTGNAGEIWVMLEVILGYVALGGLISIFTTKLVPPR